MASRKFLLAGVCAIVACGCEKTDTSPKPVFAGQTFEAAWSTAKTTGKVFLVDATASWCVPCKQMDETTWKDERVRAWIGEHAVAVQFDVDEQSGRAKALRIEGMPTLIVFKGDEEFDRVIGYQDADQLLGWLDGVIQGRRAIDALREAAGDRVGADGTVDVNARFELARALSDSGDSLEAAEEFAWLWDNMLDHEPAMYGVRLSYMVGDMARLAAKNEDAKSVFVALRDRYQGPIDQGSAGPEQVIDWLSLNQVVGDEQATVSWYERVKDDPDAAAHIERVSRDLFDLMVRSERWAEAGRIHADPVRVARNMVGMKAMMAQYDDREEGFPQEERSEMRRYLEASFRREMTMLYACCLAAGRDEPAQAVAGILLAEQDNELARQELVRSALFMQRPLEAHRKWLDEAEDLGAADSDLRGQLEQALDARP